MPEAGTLATVFSWQPHRRTLFDTYDLAPLRATGPGQISFRVEDGSLWAECRFPLVRDWKSLVAEDRSLPFEHADNITALAHTLSVLAASPTIEHETYYQSPGQPTWHPMAVRLERTLWDYAGYPQDLVPREVTAQLLGAPMHDVGPALRFLAESANVQNPVARFLCVWQAMVFHIGCDAPSAVDRTFFDRMKIARDCDGPHGPETKYTCLRNMLSHPQDRAVQDYAELDEMARDLSDSLALLVLRDVLIQGDSDASIQRA